MNLRKIAFWTLVVFLFTIPFEDTIRIEGFGSFSRLFGLVAFAIGVLGLFRSRGQRFAFRLPSLFVISALMFTLWAGLSYYWTINPEATVFRLITLVQLIFMTLLMWEYIRDDKDRRIVMQTFVFGCYVAIINALSIFLISGDTDFRNVGFDPNDFSTVLALGIPIAWISLLTTKNRLLSWLNALYLPMALLAVILAASRGGLIAMLIALTIVPFTFRNLKPLQRFAIVSLVSISVIALFIYLPGFFPGLQANIERLAGTASELQEGDLSTRTNIWRAGLEVLNDNLYLGVGLGNFNNSIAPIYGRPASPHNVILSVATELGTIGLILYSLVLFFVVWPVFTRDYPYRAFHAILFMVLFVSFLPLGIEYRKMTWFTLTLLATMKPVIIRDEEVAMAPSLSRVSQYTAN
jgi:O-antigen ligase